MRREGSAISTTTSPGLTSRLRPRPALDPRTDVEREVAAATARERREAYVRGHQLTEMRKAAGLTQAELAKNLGVSQARISKIEHGEVSGVELVRAYVAALGGTVDVIATLGDRTWKVA